MIDQVVFIGGCGRSGTTMLGSILGGHKDCIATPESQFKTTEINELIKALSEKKYSQIISLLEGNFRFNFWKIKLKKEDLFEVKDIHGLFDVLISLYSTQDEGSVWIDHTPVNIREGITLNKVFKKCKFIHIVRDGRAVFSSVKDLDWGPNSVYAGAKWWVESISYGLALELCKDVEVLRVRYEDLVLNSESELERICDFIGIKYSQGCFGNKVFKVPAYTINQHSSVGLSPVRNKVDNWKGNLTNRQIEVFEYVTSDMLSYFGYEKNSKENIPLKFIEKGRLTMYELVRTFVNKVKMKNRIAKHI